MGGSLGSLYTLYRRKEYHAKVSEVYWDMKAQIEARPALGKRDDERSVVKNFGQSRWNDNDYNSDEDFDSDEMMLADRGNQKFGRGSEVVEFF
jgi:hypothetical protein|tara:strand:+ start:411 stop:689 length:279 start_codon:yes stop_codon:yes gene_type:complete